MANESLLEATENFLLVLNGSCDNVNHEPTDGVLDEEMCFLGGCEHVFCRRVTDRRRVDRRPAFRACAERLRVGRVCPRCYRPTDAVELRAHGQLNELLQWARHLHGALVGAGAPVVHPPALPIDATDAPQRTVEQFSMSQQPARMDVDDAFDSPSPSPRPPDTRVVDPYSLSQTLADSGLAQAEFGAGPSVRRLANRAAIDESKWRNNALPQLKRSLPIEKLPAAKSVGRNSGGAAAVRRSARDRGEWALHVACQQADVERVVTLLQEDGAMPNVRDFAGWSPLHEAAIADCSDAAEALLANGAFVDATGVDYRTPLHEAVLRGHVAVARVLVDFGADVTAVDSGGSRPVDVAADLAMRQALQTRPTRAQTFAQLRFGPWLRDRPLKIALSSSTSLLSIKLAAAVVRSHSRAEQKSFALDDTSTHLVVEDSRLVVTEVAYLEALLRGIWIVSSDWLEACAAAKSLVAEAPFEVDGGGDTSEELEAPRRARQSHMLGVRCSVAVGSRAAHRAFQLQQPRLFDGCSLVFASRQYSGGASRVQLERLIVLGGGHLLKRLPSVSAATRDSRVAYHAPQESSLRRGAVVVVEQPGTASLRRKLVDPLRLASPAWLRECIYRYCLLEPY